MTMDSARCALVLVDFQQRLMPAIEGGEAALRDAVFLARVAREIGVPVVGTEQNPAGLGPNDDRVRALCDRTLAKARFDAAADGLADHLRSLGRGVDQVVVAGCEAHVCLLQTALGLQQAGFRVFAVPEACASRRASDKAAAMRRLESRGVTLASPEMAAFEWLGSSSHPRFAAVLALVKERPVG